MRKKHLGGRNRVQHREYAVSAADLCGKVRTCFSDFANNSYANKNKAAAGKPCGSLNACFKDESVNTALCLSHSANSGLQPQKLLTECG